MRAGSRYRAFRIRTGCAPSHTHLQPRGYHSIAPLYYQRFSSHVCYGRFVPEVPMEPSVVNTSSRLEKLLEDFGRIRGPSSSPATFLETAGYPHFENVASNILEFFLDPTEEHGLSTLFLDALLAPLALERLSFQGVTREAGTENGKRIDLVIDCESHVIGVENKVFASVYNPLEEYRAHLRKEAGDREAVLMLLCLREPPIGTLPPDVAVVTYEQLMRRVRQNLGMHAAEAPGQYLTFALDFVKTMENLRKGNRMNPAVLDLFTEKKDDVVKFLHAVREVSKELRGIVERTGEIVTENLPDGLPQKVHKWFYREERNLLDDLVHDVEFPSGSKVAIDAYLSLDGWEVVVWQRRCSIEKLLLPDLVLWLRERGVPFLVAVDSVESSRTGRVTTGFFPFDAPLEEVAAHVTEVVAAVARAGAAPGE